MAELFSRLIFASSDTKCFGLDEAIPNSSVWPCARCSGTLDAITVRQVLTAISAYAATAHRIWYDESLGADAEPQPSQKSPANPRPVNL